MCSEEQDKNGGKNMIKKIISKLSMEKKVSSLKKEIKKYEKLETKNSYEEQLRNALVKNRKEVLEIFENLNF